MNAEKQLTEALKGMRDNSYPVIDEYCGIRRKPFNFLPYYQYEKQSIEAQEEISRKNKTAILKEMAEKGITKGSFKVRVAKFKSSMNKEKI